MKARRVSRALRAGPGFLLAALALALLALTGGMGQRTASAQELVCGVDIVLLIDKSGSIQDSGLVDEYVAGLTSFTTALAGTDADFAVFDFAETSTRRSNWGAAPVIDDTFPSERWTDWEEALLSAIDQFDGTEADRDGIPDVAILVTDGLPTQSSAGANDNSQPNAHLAPAIVAANALKTAGNDPGVTIYGVGISLGTSGLANLQQVADQVYDSSFETLGADLSALAAEGCEGGDGELICVDGEIVPAQQGLTPTNDCDPVRLCVDGRSVTVTQFEAEQLLGDDDLDVSRGSCTPAEDPPDEEEPEPTPVPPTPVPTQEVQGVVATPTPIAEVESIQPPATGDAGLSRDGGGFLYVAAAGAAGLLLASALVLRRKSA